MTTFIIFRFILAVLFTYRLSQILSLDDGPFLMFNRIRSYTDRKKMNEEDKEKVGIWTTVDGILHCQYCSGVYVALLAMLLFQNNSKVGFMFLLWGAIAGAHAFLLDVIDFRGLKN